MNVVGVGIQNRVAILWSLCVAMLWGCAPELPEPELWSVSPQWGYNGEVTPIRIDGEALYPSVAVDGGEGTGGRVDAQYQVELHGAATVHPLKGVTLVDYSSIEALVPDGLGRGLYDLVVRTPAGKTSRLEQAFTVTNTRADSLEIEVDAVVHQVNESVAVSLSVRDPDGLLVEQDLEVELELTSERQAEGVLIQDSGLEDSSPLESGVGIRGNLGPDGRTVVVLTSSVPDELELALRPVETNSIVRADETPLVFEAAEMDSVEILLPTEDFAATAGEEFSVVLRVVDSFGNMVEDQSVRVILVEECGGFLKEVTVVGSLSTVLSVEKATDMHCPINRITAVSEIEGSSVGFPVLPGALERFSGAREDGDALFMAGEPGLFRVWGEDAFGNTVGLENMELAFEDSEFSLREASCLLVDTQGAQQCEILFEQAVSSTELRVLGGGVESAVGTYPVLPNAPSQVFVGGLGSAIVAGELFALQVSVKDAWGNPLEIDPAQTGFEVDDGGLGTVTCTVAGSGIEGGFVLDCMETTASEQMVFSVHLPSLGLAGSTDILVVRNADLASVVLSPTSANMVAGSPFDLLVEGFDAFGNPYTYQASANLELTDSESGINQSQAQLGPDGSVNLTGVTLNQSGDPVVVTASQAGVPLGQAHFVVTHGPVDRLEVETFRSWAWVGQPYEVAVYALDSYGNRVLDFSEGVQLTSSQSGFLTQGAGAPSDGVYLAELTWGFPAIGDRIVATALSASGTSGLLDAVVAECLDGPEANAVFDATSSDEMVLCDTGSPASQTVDFVGSMAGGSPIAMYHFWTEEGSVRGTSTSGSFSADGVGVHTGTLLVVDSSGCADVDRTTLWIGEDNGSPAGPVGLVAAQSPLTAGSLVQGETSVDVSAFDCAGDVASNQSLLVRSNLGDVDHLRTSVVESGEGLLLTLDSSGEASFPFSVLNSDFGGLARVETGSSSGLSYGALEVVVEGDNAQPRVAWMDPAGRTAALWEEIFVSFTDMMDPVSLLGSVSLQDSQGADIGFVQSLVDGGSTLRLALGNQADGAVEAYTLSISGAARDASGNFLDGDWTGQAVGSDFVGRFGDVVDQGIAVSSCVWSSSSFRPDGDDSSTVSEQLDSVSVEATSSALGEYWKTTVHRGVELVRTELSIPLSTTETVSWDGRGDDGMVLPAGLYRVTVSVMDAQGNEDAGCEQVVELEQAYGAPEYLE